MDGTGRQGSEHEDLTPELAERLRALRCDAAPPSAMEERLVAAQRRTQTGGRVARWAAIAAAVMAAYAAGWYTSQRPPVAGTSGGTYVLFLYGGTQATDSVEAHRRWARDLMVQGRLVGGVKLKSEASAAGGSEPRGEEAELGGYFMIRAESLAEALGIARTSPHHRSGGRVVVRPVDPV